MPVVEIRALPQKPPADVPNVLERVCTELATVLDIAEKRVWATWETIEGCHYVEGRQETPDQVASTHPPLVRVLAFEGRSDDVVRVMLETGARRAAEVRGLEGGNVRVTYEARKPGRVWSGGRVLD